MFKLGIIYIILFLNLETVGFWTLKCPAVNGRFPLNSSAWSFTAYSFAILDDSSYGFIYFLNIGIIVWMCNVNCNKNTVIVLAFRENLRSSSPQNTSQTKH